MDKSTWLKTPCPHCGKVTVHRPLWGVVSTCQHCKKRFSFERDGITTLSDDYEYALSPRMRQKIQGILDVKKKESLISSEVNW